MRFNNGGSGSFVSADGLVMTNHHVGSDALQKLSTKSHDLMRSSFYARTQAEELKCPDSELNVLMSIEDVTARVNAAVTAPVGSAEAEKQRRAVMNTIEKESFDKTGLRSDVITLYQGGLYQLYRYKKYTDVRLVFAPEEKIAFFGGDPDNFEYPRYDLDICFFRVYENGKPAKTPYYLKWNPAGLKPDDLVFVAGNPGKTDRLDTVRHLEFIRDFMLPTSLNILRRREVLLDAFSERSAENARRARDLLLAYQNSRKARLGGLAGLQDPAVMERKKTEENDFLAAAAKRPETREQLQAGDGNDRQITLRFPVHSRRLRPAGTRPGLLQRVVHHRPHARPHGRGDRQAQRRPAARIPRVEPRFAAGSNSSRRRRSTRTCKRICWPTRSACTWSGSDTTTRWPFGCWPASRRASGRRNWSAAPTWPTSPCGVNWPKGASRRSRPRTIR